MPASPPISKSRRMIWCGNMPSRRSWGKTSMWCTVRICGRSARGRHRLGYLYPHGAAESIKQFLGKDYIFDEEQVIRLGLDMCDALYSCHENNIIHRDNKTEKNMVNGKDRCKMGDFGIAKISERTATGTMRGTYSYMAPEIANHLHYGASSDIYSQSNCSSDTIGFLSDNTSILTFYAHRYVVPNMNWQLNVVHSLIKF